MTQQAQTEDRIMTEALAWQNRLAQDDADWDAYTAWLEADPRHPAAFDTVEFVGGLVDDHRDAVRPLLQTPAATTRRHRWTSRPILYLGGGIAAVLALFLALPGMLTSDPMRTYQAGGDAPRVISLARGVAVTLSPASRIVVGGDDDRIEVASGEAYFDVRHEPSRTLVVMAGDQRITDIGTQFTVNLSGQAVRVSVAQGTVAVSSVSRPEAVDLTAGQQLLWSQDRLTVAPVAVTDVGSWRAGRLSYNNAPLSLVAADISRYSGRPVTIDPSLESMHFSGSLVIGDGSGLLRDLATVLGTDIARDEDGDHIGGGSR